MNERINLIFIFLNLLSLIYCLDDPLCDIVNSNKIDCARDLASQTNILETKCYERGCCYKKIDGDTSIPWCY